MSTKATHDTLPAAAGLGAVRIVLVGTTHPGNIGAAARAMKTMGLYALWLVAPERFPAAEATALASGADDVLAAARVVDTLDEALQGCRLVVGTSARSRTHSVPVWTPFHAAERLMAVARRLAQRTSDGAPPLSAPDRPTDSASVGVAGAAVDESVALVFGREHSGLTNDELDRCQAFVQIPANPAYSSLNLAAAVQVLCFCLREAAAAALGSGPTSDACAADPSGDAGRQAPLRSHDAAPAVGPTDAVSPALRPLRLPARFEAREGLVRHALEVAERLGYLDPAQPGLFERRIRHWLARAEPDDADVRMLRGVLTAIERHIAR